jgi:hypothetical protein
MSNMRPHRTSVSYYDAVVLGAGLSGLTAAAILAQAGARVLGCTPICSCACAIPAWSTCSASFSTTAPAPLSAWAILGCLWITTILFAATPRTIVSLTGSSDGAIMGWSYRRGRGLPRGSFLQMRGSVLQMRRSVLPRCRGS